MIISIVYALLKNQNTAQSERKREREREREREGEREEMTKNLWIDQCRNQAKISLSTVFKAKKKITEKKLF